MRLGRDCGRMSLKKVCVLVAPIERISRSFPSSQARNPPSTLMTVTITHISTVIVTIAFMPAPIHTMIIGPSAIFGRELSVTIYGSNTRRAVLLDQSPTAMKKPSALETTKPTMHSRRVMPTCFKRSCFMSVPSVFIMRMGELVMKSSITPVEASSCQSPRKSMSTAICSDRTLILSRLTERKYAARAAGSSEYFTRCFFCLSFFVIADLLPHGVEPV